MQYFLKLKRYHRALAALLVLSFVSGCSTPRTGIYFQSTKSCGNDDTWGELAYYGVMLSPFVIPSLVLLPPAGIGYSLDHYVFSPMCDVVCLPFDFYLRNTGPYIKVVDSGGKPISHAHVVAPVITGVGTYTFTGETDEQGLFYIPLSWENSRLGQGEVTAELDPDNRIHVKWTVDGELVAWADINPTDKEVVFEPTPYDEDCEVLLGENIWTAGPRSVLIVKVKK